jgi:colanic acid biosynthesis glycosyl transferase WcaI
MKILIVSMHYAPEAAGNAPYVTDLAEYLARRGNDVHVLAGVPYYPRWRVHRKYRHIMWRRESLNGVTVHRHRQYVPRNPSALRRAISEATSLATGSIAGVSMFSDVVLGVVPTVTDGLLAASIGRIRGVPYALVFQDLVAMGAMQSGIASKRVSWLVTSLERHMVARAKSIGIVTTGFRPHLEALGVAEDSIFRLRNWNRISTRYELSPVRRSLGQQKDGIVCVHAGNMGAKQALENVIECARLAQIHLSRLYFILMGDGNQRPRLEQLAARYRLRNLRFLDPQPSSEYANMLRLADILIVNQRQALTDMALPSKLTAYFAAARPVVAAVHPESEAASEIRSARAGVICPPENPQALFATLANLAENPQLRKVMGSNGVGYCRDHLDPERVLPEWALFIERLSS